MAYSLIILKRTRTNVWEAMEWYNEQSPGLGYEVLKEFYACLPKLRNHPTRFSHLFDKFRKMRLKRFPYYIVFSIDEKRKRVVVTAFWHVKRDWQALKKLLKK